MERRSDALVLDFFRDKTLEVAFVWPMAVAAARSGRIRIGEHNYAFRCKDLQLGRLDTSDGASKVKEGTLYMVKEGDGRRSHERADIFFLATRLAEGSGKEQKYLVVIDVTGSPSLLTVKRKALKAWEKFKKLPRGVEQMAYAISPTLEKEWEIVRPGDVEAKVENNVDGKVDKKAKKAKNSFVDGKVDENTEYPYVVGGDAARRLMGSLGQMASLWVDHADCSEESGNGAQRT
jgi:hypothetical protein